MNLKDLKTYFKTELSPVFELSEIEVLFYRLVEHQLSLSKIDVILKSDFELNSEGQLFFKSAIQELKEEKPIQYIIGSTEFYGLSFKVTEATLIPRPETEELVDWIVKDNSDKNKLSILDIGTGSGCIPICLAKNLPKGSISTLDVSEEAIKIAQENAKMNEVVVEFINDDILIYSGCSEK